MKRFEFKLQAVLTLRQRGEQAALEKYARAIQHRQACAARSAEAEMELSEARRQWLNALADGVPAVRAAQMLGYCHLLEARKRQCEQTLELADIDLNRSSHAMLHARQQREAVETLMAHQRERYDRRAIDEERKMIDDLINRRPTVGPGATAGLASDLSRQQESGASNHDSSLSPYFPPLTPANNRFPRPHGPPPPDALN